jgi:Glycosyl hydrolases family 18
MLLKTRNRETASGVEKAAASSLSGWRRVTSASGGQFLVRETGLSAIKDGLVVVRPDGQALRRWPWASVLDIRVVAALGRPVGDAHWLVELHVEGAHHVFLCSEAELGVLRSSLERRAPGLCAGFPAQSGAHVRSKRAVLREVAAAGRSSVRRAVSALRHRPRSTLRARWRPIGAGMCALVLGGAGLLAGTGAFSAPASSRTSGGPGGSIMERMEHEYGSEQTVELPAASTPPAPAPPSVANATPLGPHEVFGFAPYWTLDQASDFDVGDLTTIAYFSVEVNADGSIEHSGSGWVGYESEDLSELITKAHDAGDRVVLTASCFDQGALNALTSSQSAGETLASQLVGLLEEKNLDGVNLDFEGQGASDQGGLDHLVAQVSQTLHATDPHWQVTMDTYASSASDPEGFYDISGLAPYVDGFFVMAYDMDDPSVPSPTAPLSGPGFSDLDALESYTSVVPASKVILGVPYYGYDWPTTGPAQGDPATGPPTPVSYSQVVSDGHPIYWDPTTQTPWTSFEVGSQWHQIWFDDPTSLALKAQLANKYAVAGVGVWALGMDGNDPQMLSALLGDAPVVKDYVAAPVAGRAPDSVTSPTSATAPSPSGSEVQGEDPSDTGPSDTGPSDTGSSQGSTTTTTTIPAGTIPAGTIVSGYSYSYSGTWDDSTVTLDLLSAQMAPIVTGKPIGSLTGFSTTDPDYSCLEPAKSLPVYSVSGASGVYVVEASTPADCVAGTWEFVAQPQPDASGTTEGATTTSEDQTRDTTTPIGTISRSGVAS